ncbi:protein TonB [Modicisalibacter ilicicola DSM 19980]|uniref:Protein TonB n=1 Tax=Modicisalibacter ilicicola DSM 19980 TaxID=1121942 RepID=A0A1M4VPW3_9GAMM|nr:energy transducer TonB [Halomonas ilicicola]SHE70890.1 protein TonB [Halomonas ilicicola DSM 19980]
MAASLDFSFKAPIGRRHRTLSAWALAILLHGAIIGGLAHWRLVPPPPKTPVGLDVAIVTQAAVKPGAAQEVVDADRSASQEEAAEPPPQVEPPPVPAAAETNQPQAQPAPEPEPSPEPAAEAAPTPESPSTPEPAPEPSSPGTPSSPSGAKTAPSGRSLLAQASESVRQQGFTAPASANESGDRDREAVRRAAETRYIDAWTRRVETYGNRHHPAPGALDGQLRIRVVIGRDGQVRQAEVLQSSGHPELDQAALKTVHGAAPYRPFDSGMGERDSLTITRTWRFGKGNSFGVR